MWLQLTCVVEAASPDLSDRLSDTLSEAGAVSVDFADADEGTAAELPQFDEPGVAVRSGVPEWTRLKLTALFPIDSDAAACAREGFAACQLSLPPHRIETLQDADWVRLTQSQFEPIEITPTLWIVPTWHDVVVPEAINIRVDPGVAFGTGSHPTTKLCLQWLAATVKGGESVLDYGCGSGVLAIAAAKLGATRVVGVDIDKQAVQASVDNALQNQVDAQFFSSAGAPPKPAQLLVANILTNPLLILAPLLAKLVLPGGQIALSGILTEQAEEIVARFNECGLVMAFTQQDQGWALVTGNQPSQ